MTTKGPSPRPRDLVLAWAAVGLAGGLLVIFGGYALAVLTDSVTIRVELGSSSRSPGMLLLELGVLVPVVVFAAWAARRWYDRARSATATALEEADAQTTDPGPIRHPIAGLLLMTGAVTVGWVGLAWALGWV